MPFPRSPNKTISNKLKLVIRPADTEVQLEADPREEYLEAEDFSEGFKVKLPKGFTLDSTSESVLEKQRKAALQRIEDIKDKQRACSNCRKITSELSLENATANEAVMLLFPTPPIPDNITIDFI